MDRQNAAGQALDFILDESLRKTIEDAIQYIYIIFDQTETSDSALYKEETYRVIVLYVISVIEAVLLYVLKTRGEKIEYIDYKYVTSLPRGFIHKEVPENPVVVAVQKRQEKADHQIGLVEMVEFMKNSGLMSDSFAEDILKANDIRNTFHLTKPRSVKCEVDTVDLVFDLLIKVIKRAPKAITFNKN